MNQNTNQYEKPGEKKTFNIGFIQRLKHVFNDRNFGNIITDEKFSKSVGFYFKLLLFFVAILSVSYFFKADNLTKHITQVLEEDVPDFHFDKGKLNVSGTMPLRIDDERAIIVVDTTDQTTLNQLKPTTTNKQIFLVTSKGVSFYNPQGMDNPLGEFIDFDPLGELSITKDEIIDGFTRKKTISLVMTAMLLLGFILHKLVMPIYMFLLAKIIALFRKVPLKNGPIFAIVLYALTVPNTLHFVTSGLGFTLPFFQWIYLGLGAFFVIRFYNNLDIVTETKDIE